MEEKFSGYEILDHGAGKSSTCFGKGPLLGDSEMILCMKSPSGKACSGQKCQKLRCFQGEKVPLHYKQCKVRLLWSLLMYPQSPRVVRLCHMDLPCLLLECLSIWFSEERIITMKSQTIILTQGYKYSRIF